MARWTLGFWTLASFLAARPLYLGAVNPFGLALVAALGRTPSSFLALWAAAAVGTASGHLSDVPAVVLGPAVALVVARSMKLSLPDYGGPLLAGGLLTARLGLGLVGWPGGLTAWPALIEALGLALAAGLLLGALGPKQPVAARPIGASNQERAAALALAIVISTAGLQRTWIGPFDAGTATLWLASGAAGWAGGPALGALTGLLVAAGASLVGKPAILLAEAGLAGAMAGALRPFGRWGAAVGLLLARVMALYVTGSDDLIGLLGEAAVAAGLLLATPRRFVAAFEAVFAAPASPRAVPVASSAMAAMETAAAAPHAIQVPVGAPLDQLANLLRRMAQAFERAPAAPDLDAGVGVNSSPATPESGLLTAVSDRLCAACERYALCWERHYPSTARDIGQLWTAVADGKRSSRLPGELAQRCIHPTEMRAVVSHIHDLEQAQQFWRRRLREGRQLAAAQLSGLAQALDRLARASGRVGSSGPSPTPRLLCQTGVARLPRPGYAVSGDAHLIRQPSPDLAYVALSDGMGTGLRAADESRTAIELLDALLQAGFEAESAVQCINAVLLLRSPEEMFATLDLAVLDFARARARFLKVGAAPSFLCRPGRASIVRGTSLPVGILREIELDASERSLQAGDLLVMMTDGAWESFGPPERREAAVMRFLTSLRDADPARVAAALLAKAVEAGNPSDDMTVVALALQENTG